MSFFKQIRKTKNYCYIIAEAGVNHVLNDNDLEKLGVSSPLEVAFKMVDAAKEAGVDAIKFQSFTAENLQFKGVEKPQYQKNNVGNDNKITYFDLIKNLETSTQDQIQIANYCKEKGITFISTPYDNESVDFLDEIIDIPFFKLASIEVNNHLFLKYVAQKGKTILLSTGLSTFEDVKEVVEIARQEGFVDNLILLQCTTNYPTEFSDINLNVLKTYQKEFPDIKIGFSDHSPSYTASIGAVALGSIVVEKHFTLNKNFEGPDHASSLNPSELEEWVKRIRELSLSLGSYDKIITESEKKNLTMRKFLVITPQKKDTIIKENLLRTMRTGDGILPTEKNLKKIISKRLKIDINKLTPLNWDIIY
ncbi:MAG: N-acetylneuraminate synthase family protein [Candidatus Hodarchaeota archaeon]